MMTVSSFIRKSMKDSLRVSDPADTARECLPKPFNSPSQRGMFVDMYYWDTYFTNLGLLAMGDTEQAYNNACDLRFLLDKYGYVPNMNNLGGVDRSQPPFLTRMVWEIWRREKDEATRRALLDEFFPSLEREHWFWMTERATPIGLARYGCQCRDRAGLIDFCRYVSDRVGKPMPAGEDACVRQGADYLAEAESGWDFNPRFGFRCLDYAPADLNGILMDAERHMAQFADAMGNPERASYYLACADIRAERMRRYLLGEDGIFYDYNYVTGERGTVKSCAGFWPVIAGAGRDAAGTARLLAALEQEHGITVCEKGSDREFLQWDYPNMWPCLSYFAVEALLACGRKADATRVAEKYCATVEKNFDTTGDLWEKYDAVSGEIAASHEYQTQPLLGWTAGVYLYCRYQAGLGGEK